MKGALLCSYSKKPGVSTFRFAKDISAKNYRKQDKCNVNVVLNWKRELQSSCFSTPVLYPFFKDGNSDVQRDYSSLCADYC